MKKFFLIIFIACGIWSCNTSEQEVEDLKEEVIAIHDEVMPKMDKIMELKRDLKSLKEKDSTQTAKIENEIQQLNEADEAMMNWMRNYDAIMTGKSNDEKLTYLGEQKLSIKMVREKMLNSINSAEEYLENNN